MSLLSDLVPMGTSGYSGYSGYSGNSGSSGYSAYSGYSGYSAYSGTSGYSGYSGYSSTSGVSGYSAYSGVSGTSGYSGAVGSTPTTIDVTVTAGEALSARDCCYIAPVTGGGLTAGRAYKADADTVRQSTQGFWCGFATGAISAAATGTVRVAGVLTGFTLTAGAPQYISATAGSITETAPTNSRLVGIALDTTNLLINTRGANTAVTSWATKGYCITATNGELMTVSTETFAVKDTALTPNSQSAGISEGVSKAFIAGGNYIATAFKLTFATDTSAAASTANLSLARAKPGGLNANTTNGYFLGGSPSAGNYSAVSDKCTYSTDTTAAVTTANLSQARSAGACNQLCSYDSKGYVVGGYASAGYVVTGDKVTYSNDTTAASTASNLSAARSVALGVSDGSTKGFMIGGNSGTIVATGDKLTYSNDTTAAATTSNSSVTRGYGGSFSTSSSYGYLLGGYTAITWASTTTTDRVTFSTDTTAARTIANINAAKAWSKGVADLAF